MLALLSTGSGTAGPVSGWPRWGLTHTQYSVVYGHPEAIARARAATAATPLLQNQHIMGFGAGNPQPAPGVYDFTSLDDRIGFIRSSNGIPIITLCCAPDWMKGGRPGQTDWNRLEKAPERAHFDDFAALSAKIALRYPKVRHFIVWNELKGFFDEKRNRWDAAAYTDLYNQVYDALKAVNPQIRVGGPYITMHAPPAGTGTWDSALSGPWGTVDRRALDAFEYWLRHKRGADFVVIDGRTAPTGTVDAFGAVQKFAAASRWVRERTDLPLWWAEWYVQPEGTGWSRAQQVAVRTAAMIEFARSGVQAALYWSPEPASNCASCLWTDTANRQGGQPQPMLAVLQRFARWFPTGTRLVDVPAPPQVRVLAQEEMLVVVNTRGSVQRVTVDGRDLRLAPYETRWVPRS